ncbi:hypothetical protein M9Y10_044733 [Tritrichomonas musculus]|uniref:DnaK protein n=1 Tax=Tritrichomonas musculus TaxID=1915356 RepID=A0ABR2JUE4_9EUKA
MFLPFLVVFSFSSIYSLDIGSQNIRVASSVTGKPVEIKLNDRDHRSTENYLAFPLSEKLEKFEKVNWLIGSDAERISMVNSSYGFSNPFAKLWTPDKYDFNGLHPVTLAATALYQHMKSIKMKNDKLTLIVPTYASPQYRELLYLTAKVTGYKSTSILDSSTAVATYYSIERIKKGSRKPITILFVDIGAENADYSLWKYRPLGEKLFMELLQYRHSGQVGGGYVDRLLLNLIEPLLGRKLVRSERYIVMKALRKAKEHLVNQTSTTINFNEDFGKYITLNQSDVQRLTANMTEKIIDLIGDMTPPDEIELIGGSSRLQVFIDAITTAFPNIPVRRSLNSDEAAALGGAYFTALRTGTIIGSKIELKKPAIFGLNSTIDGQEVEIYQPGDTIKDRKFIMYGNRTRIVKNYLDLDVYDDFVINSTNFNKTNKEFNEVLIQGIEKALKQVSGIMLNNSQPVISLKYGLSPELDCFDLIDASLVVNITSKHRTRSSVLKDAKVPQKEVKLYLLSIPSDKRFRIPENTSTFLKAMINADEDRLKMEENCHKLETFIIETRDAAQYDDEMFRVTTEDERKLIIKNLDEARVEIDCTNLSKEETSDSIDRKLRNLRASFLDPIERYEDAIKRPNALIKLHAALDRAEAARKSALCDNETLEEFNKYLNETYDKLEKMENDKPLDQPSFPVSEIKEREKELLKKIPEVKRAAKKKEVINFSSSNTTDMDDDEYERLKNVGISVQKPKKKAKKDIDPEIIKLKEKRIYELEKEQNFSRGAFNNSRRLFHQRKQKFEKEHNLQLDPWKPPDEEACRNTFRRYEGYLNRKKERAEKIRLKKEKIKREREEERLRIEAEKNRPPTPTLSPEEAKRVQKIQEEEERKKKEEEENIERIKNETDLFKQIGSTMFDYDELNGEDEEALYKKYKTLKKKFEHDRSERFDDDEKREAYMEERKNYEDLRRRFENDPERKRKELEKKKLAKKKREEKQAKEDEKTELDIRIEDLEIDQRRLTRDLELLKQDIQDFDKLEKSIIRKELHDIRKKKRREEREKKKIEKRSRTWDQRAHDLLSNSETETESESPTSFYDEIPDYSELDYNDIDRYRYDSSSSEDEEEAKRKKKEAKGDEIDDSDVELTSESSSSSSESHEEHERERKADFEIEQKEREKQKVRHLIDPDTFKFNYTKDEIREMKKNGFKIPAPKTLYRKRFEDRFVDYEEKYNAKKREKNKKPPLNPDDHYITRRENQFDEIGEDLEL